MLGNSRIITIWSMLDQGVRRALVKSAPLFAGFSTWQARKLIAACTIEEHPPGELLIRDGDPGDTMYVVLEGELEVSKGAAPHRLVFSRLGPGQVIGEVALVAKVQRTADVTAVTPVKVLVLDWDSLSSLQRLSPFLAARFYLNLSRILGQRLASTLEKVATHAPFNPPSGPSSS
jgi:CRP-like cAMP-binding protein